MNSQSVSDILKFPFENGFLVFTLGILFILSIYHALLYFQHKDKLYLLYSAYTFFIILSQLEKVPNGFIFELLNPIEEFKYFPEFYTEIYYIIYFFFAFKFLNVHLEFPKWRNYCFKAIYILIAICAIHLIIYIVLKDENLLRFGYYLFVAYITILSIVAYVIFFRLKNNLKYYIIIGGLLLSLCSYISLGHYLVLLENLKDIQPAYGILYVGFILENVFFSLGLGQKQKQILNERNDSQHKLILQLKENERLKHAVEKQLKKDIETLNKQAKADQLEKLNAKYEKELSELKMTSLRSQMNPHFIFNSLNSIKRYIIDNEKENAVYYLNKFSKLIRNVLATTKEKEISLFDEIETMTLYVNIENIRFNNEIDFLVSIDEGLNLNAIKMPPLILQPFLENAIWHGLSLKKESKMLSLKIDKHRESHVTIVIEDNGIGRKRSTEIKKKKIHKRESIGIKLTEERLKNFAKDYKYNYSLNFIDLLDENKKSSGTQVIIKLPMK